MNNNFLAIVRRIIAEQGEDILSDPQRLKSFVSDYAKNESKPERLAFGRCIEYGFYGELKKTASADERVRLKTVLAQKLHSEQGLNLTLCAGTLDMLEAAVWGYQQPMHQQVAAVSTGAALPPQTAAPAPATPAAMPQYATAASTPLNSQQSAVVKSTLSKSGVTALILSIATFVVEMIAVGYMLVDGWFSGYFQYYVNNTPTISASISTDWIIGYVPLYLACLLTMVFGLISIYGKRNKNGLIGVIVTVVNFTILLAGHIMAPFML
jgi:hypothetical protein